MRRIQSLMILALVAAGLPAAADPTGVPPIVGGALASSNVELVASIPDVPAIGGRFVGDYLYMSTSQGLRIYDTDTLDGVPLLTGALELPHFENEDVDTDGNILLISADHGLGLPNNLYVVDVSNPMLPALLGVSIFNDEGHTISCIPHQGNGCAYAWIAGSRTLPIFDLRDPSEPTQVASLTLPRPDPNNPNDTRCNAGGSHDVQLDDAGIAWVSAGGGLFGFDYANPTSPTLVYENCAKNAHNTTSFNSSFILHNSQRPNGSAMNPSLLSDSKVDPGELVLVTEEDYASACMDEGAFQTGWLRSVDGEARLDRVGTFTLGMGTVANGAKVTGGLCSSHYFDYRADGIVSVAWYEQGVRFLDVSTPGQIRQVGYYLPLVTEMWNAQWKPGTNLVYTFDVARGLEVLKFTGAAGDPTVLAPRLNEPSMFSQPSARFGYACRTLNGLY